MIAVDAPGLKGVRVRGRSGPVRDRWVEMLSQAVLSGTPVRRISAGTPAARLIGGLDVGRSIERGARILESGVMAGAHGGLLIVSMAERLEPASAASIGAALDDGFVRIERDGVSAIESARFALVALDEGIDDEGVPGSLADRLALRVDLDPISLRDMEADTPLPNIGRARELLPHVAIPDEFLSGLCAASLLAGSGSARAALHLGRVARAAAALRGDIEVRPEDLATALRLVLGVQLAGPDQPSAQEETAEPDRTQAEETDGAREPLSGDALRDMLIQSAAAVLPPGLLASLDDIGTSAARRATAGKAGAALKGAMRGRAIGTTDRRPASASRIDVLATLRQAAPWQRVRAAARQDHDTRRLRILKSDFRYMRYRERTGTTAIFAVDASGSAAVERLAETKGAVELLLSECYARRDQVALIAFRGKASDVLLEPTRSLVRAKRNLSSLPGGGGTPLASGIMATLSLATASIRKGQTVVAVFLTDGRGNVGLDGGTEKSRVAEDTLKAARLFRAAGLRAIVIDAAQRPQERARLLAQELGAEYLPLPRGGSRGVAREIGQRMED